MRHDVVLEGFNCRLRPVCEEDAEFIVMLRNQDRAKGRIGSTSQSVDAQVGWLRDYFRREKDYYWIIESLSDSSPIGTIGLYDFTADGLCAMSGRWVMVPQIAINIMAPVFLLYRFAFEKLCLKQLVFSVMPDNRKVVRFQLICGARETAVPSRYQQHENESNIRQRWFAFDAKAWQSMKSQWEPVLNDYSEEG